MDDRRLIEDYPPPDIPDTIASKEKMHPLRYIELVHYRPARCPITASRAAIHAALIPTSHSDDEHKEATDFVAGLAPRVSGGLPAIELNGVTNGQPRASMPSYGVRSAAECRPSLRIVASRIRAGLIRLMLWRGSRRNDAAPGAWMPHVQLADNEPP